MKEKIMFAPPKPRKIKDLLGESTGNNIDTLLAEVRGYIKPENYIAPENDTVESKKMALNSNVTLLLENIDVRTENGRHVCHNQFAWDQSEAERARKHREPSGNKEPWVCP
jgi:hypothetical protein